MEKTGKIIKEKEKKQAPFRTYTGRRSEPASRTPPNSNPHQVISFSFISYEPQSHKCNKKAQKFVSTTGAAASRAATDRVPSHLKCCHLGEHFLSVCGDGWFNLCTLITQCATGVQPHPAPESNQTGPGEAASTSHHPHILPP